MRFSPRIALGWAGLLFFLTPFFYAFAFCFPRGDDFDEATRAMFLFDLPGGLYEIAREWLTWSGRYTYHFLAVFLGAAAESRLAYGCVCGCVLLLYGYAAARLATALNCCKRCFFGLLAMLALCVSHQGLGNFYLLTDALTTGLQGALFVLFLAELCCWRAGGCSWKRAAIIGIIAIGVYEHAALAVFMTVLLVCVAAVSKPGVRRDSMVASANIRGNRQDLFKIVGCVLSALLISFCAPGNFNRSIQRGVSTWDCPGGAQIGNDLFHVLESFIGSQWPLGMLFLAALAVFLQARPPAAAPRFSIIPLILAAFVLFSVSILLLHSHSDVPFFSEPKLLANLCFYAAIAWGGMAWLLIARFVWFHPQILKYCRPISTGIVSGLFFLAAISLNFNKTLINAVNGEMFILGEFMEQRRDYLDSLVFGLDKPARGLIGEIQNPQIRRKMIDPALPQAVVAAWTQPVFPVYVRRALADSPRSWPNLWAASMYGLGSVTAVPPDAANAYAVLLAGKFISLHVPEDMYKTGVSRAFIGSASGRNRTFKNVWLVIESEKEMQTISVLRPNPLSRARLAPFFLQKYLMGRLAGSAYLPANEINQLAATQLLFKKPFEKKGGYLFFSLGISDIYEDLLRAGIFISIDGSRHYRLAPQHTWQDL